MTRTHHMAAVVGLALLGALPAYAAPLSPAQAMKQVDIQEHLGEKLPLDLPFVDQNGKKVVLGDYFKSGKPVLLSLVYFRCPMLCSLILSGEAKVMRQLTDLKLGQDYEAVTISFDPHDTPADAETKQHNYLQAMGNPDLGAHWSFLTGQPAAITPLTKAIGFEYYYDSSIQQFAHPAAVFLISPDGKISRYLYQISFDTKQLKLGLVDAAKGHAGTVIDRTLLTCYRYDTATKKYQFYIWGFIRLGAGLSFALLAGFMGWLWYGEIKKKRKLASQGKWAA